jgi:glycosyltransferase involved in cell wall biosynthesis
MKIVQITPGSGDSFYCENCLRDQAFVKTLRSQGHDVLMVPLYLPLQNESPETLTNAPIFFGGVNVYLQQKLGVFRKTPRWLDRPFDNLILLSWVSRKAGMTSARDLGEATLSMLKGQHGRQVKELDRLVEWLSRDSERPDVIILSNVLLSGLAAALRQHLQVPVVCLLQDEEAFVDGLGVSYAEKAWDLLRRNCREISAFVSVSRAYGRRIAPKLGLDENRLYTLYMGVDMKTYQPADSSPDRPTIGFLSRMCPKRGLDTLVEAFILLKQAPELKSCQLQITGGRSRADEPFLRSIHRRLVQAGVAGDVIFIPEFLGERRQDWIRRLTVMCVPEKEEAAYGLFAMEALAMGVPVVLPEIGIFPELIALTGGGVLVKENSPQTFAAALKPLLLDPNAACKLGQQGRMGMKAHFNVEKTATDLIALLEKIVGAAQGLSGRQYFTTEAQRPQR